MGKIKAASAKTSDEKLMDLYDELASKWAAKVEAKQAKT